MRILLRGGRAVDPSLKLDGQYDLLIERGCIAAVAPRLDATADRVIDVTGKAVVPGFVDLHVHLREPGFTAKETVASGAAAAVAGGVTSVACMPNTAPPLDTAAAVELVRQKARFAGLARVYPVGTLTRGRTGQAAADFAALYAAGVRAFSDDGDSVADSRLFLEILKKLARYEDVLVIAHSEDRALAAGGVMHEGEWSRRFGLPGLPAVAETAAVARDILLAGAAGARLHLAHLSTAGSVELLDWARRRGLPVTAEVTPHHLLLTDAAVREHGAAAKVNPPLRPEEDRLAMLQALRAGLIDIIATDHAPHSAAEKERGLAEAPFGIAGLETAVPLLLTELVRPGLLSLAGLVEAYSCRPARLLGLPGGTLRRGAPADLAVLDLEAASTVEPARFYSRARHSPFAGRTLRGRPVMTLVGGEIKMDGGAVCSGE